MARKLLLGLLVQACLASAQNAAATSASAAAATDAPDPAQEALQERIVSAHASMMSLAFLLFFPAGAIIMRIGIGRRTVLTHGLLQVFAWILALTGMGLGLWLAIEEEELNSQTYHVIIGLVVVCTLALLAPLGLLHHWFYKRDGKKSLVGYIHQWLGRSLIVLGAINGGFGTQLSADSYAGTIAYGVLAGVIYVAYFIVIAFTRRREKEVLRHDATLAHDAIAEKADTKAEA